MATTASTILVNKTLATIVPTPLFSFIANVLAKSNGVSVLPYVHSLGTIILNSMLLWLLAKKFRRDTNSLLVVIKHLCISDLLNGIIFLLAPTLGLVEKTINLRNKITLRIMKVFMRAGAKYILTVSTFLLCLLTVTKMLKIVHKIDATEQMSDHLACCICFCGYRVLCRGDGCINIFFRDDYQKVMAEFSIYFSSVLLLLKNLYQGAGHS